MAAYLIKGDQREIDKVIRENRVRINRGMISFSPVESGATHDDKYVDFGNLQKGDVYADEKSLVGDDVKGAVNIDTKEPKASKRAKKSS